jgi:hypothetical protein
MLAFEVLAAWAVAWLAERAGAKPAVAAVLGICVVCVGPILPPNVALDADLYPAGYFLPNAVHSPTVTAAKAFVPFLIQLAAEISGFAAVAWSAAAGIALVALGGLAKPHYVSCLVPVVIIAGAWNWWSGRPLPWRRTAAFLAAAAALLAWTVIGTTMLAGGGTAIIAPLVVLHGWAGQTVPVDLVSIAARILSDLAFPIGVVALWPAAIRFAPMSIAWSAYGVAMAQALLLAETGHRMYDGNFMWGAQLATFGLMAAAAAWLGRSSVRWNWRLVPAWALLFAHVAYGVWWIQARVLAG